MPQIAAWLSVAVLFVPISLHAQSSPVATCDSEMCRLIASGRLPELRWPEFRDFVRQANLYYEQDGYRLRWFANGAPTRQAQAMIGVLQDAASKGLDPEDYDGSRWAKRLAALAPNDARSDLALTISVMRYISDLHLGKFNPGLFHSRLDPVHDQFDIPSMVRELAQGNDNSALLANLEPPFSGYHETRTALKTYVALAANQETQIYLPPTKKPVEPGANYKAAGQIAKQLHYFGDLPMETSVDGDRYEGPLVDAVKRFQLRHGLDPDGRIGAATLRELNTPLERRVKQLRLALERWRWAPHKFNRPPIVVNIPEFELRAFDASYHTELQMKVVVGRAYHDHQTPVFAAEMTYLTFRPYWHVPLSIQRKELLPEIVRDHSYLAKHGYEVVDARDEVVERGVDDAMLADLRSGKLHLRQAPGEKNALGLVSFMFPNEHHVYMHDTPATSLFARSRRDFSHGCIRLEQPVELAKWVLRDQPEWDEERITDAMHGIKTFNVRLENPIPVLIVYATAVVVANGDVHFFRDIYGQDAQLEAEEAKGYPTSGKKTTGKKPATSDGKPPHPHE